MNKKELIEKGFKFKLTSPVDQNCNLDSTGETTIEFRGSRELLVNALIASSGDKAIRRAIITAGIFLLKETK
tara:strand:+ start:1183 stop:1398 length:216 start_codon:yes stop_codon:yes gene_type:complete